MSLPEEDRSYQTKKGMQENIVTLLGGRIAEKLVLDDISTGASNDLERATKIAKAMVTRYGFSDRLGPIVYGQNESEVFLGRDLGHSRDYSETVAAQIDEEIRAVKMCIRDRCLAERTALVTVWQSIFRALTFRQTVRHRDMVSNIKVTSIQHIMHRPVRKKTA